MVHDKTDIKTKINKVICTGQLAVAMACQALKWVADSAAAATAPSLGLAEVLAHSWVQVVAAIKKLAQSLRRHALKYEGQKGWKYKAQALNRVKYKAQALTRVLK